MCRVEAPSVLTLALCGAVLLTGCAVGGETSAPTVTVTQTVTASPAEAAPSTAASMSSSAAKPAKGSISPRGALVKQPGELAGLMSSSGDSLVDFTIKSISADVECSEPRAREPENGTFVVLDVDLEVRPGAEAAYVDGNILNPNAFRFIGQDGDTFSGTLATAATYICFPESQRLNTAIGDGEKTSGIILLDVPAESGVLLLEESMSGNKWEWQL